MPLLRPPVVLLVLQFDMEAVTMAIVDPLETFIMPPIPTGETHIPIRDGAVVEAALLLRSRVFR